MISITLTSSQQVKINPNFQHTVVNIFLPIIFSVCFGCSKELSHRDGAFEYPQHVFWLRNKKNVFLLSTNLKPAASSRMSLLIHVVSQELLMLAYTEIGSRQNCTNGSAPLNKRATRALDKK